MANQITKIIIRNGTDLQRRTSNTTGIVFNLGEPAFCTDTKRLYIGDNTPGGTPVSVRNLGRVTQLFGSFLNSGFTQEGYYALANQGADVGDFIFDSTTRTIYSLSARSNFSTDYVPTVSDLVKFDVSTLINSTQFYYDSNLFLNVADQGIAVNNLNSNVVDGVTLVKASAASPIAIAPGTVSNGVANTNLKFIAPNALYLNNTSSAASPNIVTVYPGQVVGRTSTSNLTSVSINQILATASFSNGTGLLITPTSTSVLFELDPAYFTCVGSTLRLKTNSTVNGTLSSTGNTTLGGGTASTSNSTGALVVKGGAGISGDVNVGGDITAYASSDERLKNNIHPIEGALDKIEKINGISFEWNEKSGKTGKDYGVLAQEVEKVLPELVTTRDNGYKAVKYEKLISLLIQAVKELNKKISK